MKIFVLIILFLLTFNTAWTACGEGPAACGTINESTLDEVVSGESTDSTEVSGGTTITEGEGTQP